MAYVVPNSNADFFVSTGLSPAHENSLYFESVSAKDSYFAGLPKYSVSECTYQRENRGYIRVQLPIANLIRCDYMRFQNASFEMQWFYAFITQVNYINNLTTEVQYVIDPLITWMGYFSLKRCFVERQHVINDAIGANLADEGLSTGPYICNHIDKSQDYGKGNCYIRVQIANPNEAQANMYGGIYNPTMSSDWDASDPDAVAQYINELVQDDLQSNVVNVYMVPKSFSQLGDTNVELVTINKPYSDIDGYTPKNNKLYIYPYQYLEVDNSEGSTKDYRYEFFWRHTTPSQNICNFQIDGVSAGKVELACRPLGYNGIAYEDPSDRITMTHFPQCAWNIDNYQAYLAQSNAYYEQNFQKTQMHGLINTTANGLSGLATGHMAGDSYNSKGELIMSAGEKSSNAGLTNLLNAGISSLANLATMSADALINNAVPVELGNSLSGNVASDLQFSKCKSFIFRRKSITSNYAQMIDDYFTMYGYKVNQVLVPNMNARPHWTYVKTIGCNVNGAFPASDARQIEEIFDNGVRFWHNISEMGNYSLDNSPT